MTDSQTPDDKKSENDASDETSATSKTAPKAASKTAAKTVAKNGGKAASKTATKTVAKTTAKAAPKAKTATKKAPAKSAATAGKPEEAGQPKDKAPKAETAKPDTAKPDTAKSDDGGSSGNGDASAPTPTSGISQQILILAAIASPLLMLFVIFIFGGFSNDTGAQDQIAELQMQIERMAVGAGDPEAVGRLQVRLDGMEEDLRALNAGVARSSDVTALETSLNDARERLAVVEASGGSRSSRSGRASNNDIAALEARIAAVGNNAADQVAQVNTRVTDLEGDLVAQLNTRVAATDFAALDTRVVTLENDQLAQEMYKAATALGLAQLARTAQGSGSFAVELEALSALRPRDAFIAQLRPLAQTGIATDAMLVAEFNAMARAVVGANRASDDLGFFGRLWARITQLVSFRRTGDIEGDTVDALLARAEMRLAEGNLAAATTEIAALPEAAAAPAADWLAQAEGRVALNGLIADLSNDVIGELEQ